MAIVLADRVKETSTTTSTGTLDLDGAATGYQTFVAGAATTSVVPYCIVGQAGGGSAGEWETGYGTVTDATPDTLSRTTVIDSSNSGSLVNFSAGTKDVFLTAHTGVVGFQGALVKLTGDWSHASSGASLTIDWDAEEYDYGGWHDNSTNNDRLTVPAGVSRIRLSLLVGWDSNATGNRYVVGLKDAAGAYGLPRYSWDATGLDFQNTIHGAVVDVVEGNYFTVSCYQNSGGTRTIESDYSWFAIEKVGP